MSSSSNPSSLTTFPFLSNYAPTLITFVAGASFGLTTVLLGQPFDTVKTRMQGISNITDPGTRILSSASLHTVKHSSFHILKELYSAEGVRGLYRGGLPLIIGGTFIRSAQFGCSTHVKSWLHDHPHIIPATTIFGGTIDVHVLLSGIAGGIARSFVEIPTDFFKIRRQVQSLTRMPIQRIEEGANPSSTKTMKNIKWMDIRAHIFDGSLVTMVRNTILFASFIVYIDLSKQACRYGYAPPLLCTEDRMNLAPFVKGAICGSLAWMTCWPLDVIKTQQQSGNFIQSTSTSLSSVTRNLGTIQLLRSNFTEGRLFRGLIPGLIRSTVSSGCSMIAYESVQYNLSKYFDIDRKDLI